MCVAKGWWHPAVIVVAQLLAPSVSEQRKDTDSQVSSDVNVQHLPNIWIFYNICFSSSEKKNQTN